MKKYNLSAIMKRAWELVRKDNMTMSTALKKAWAEAKNIPSTITFCVVGKETFTVDTQTGIITGQTYNSRDFLKANFSAKWDAANKQWIVDTTKLSAELNKWPDYYKKLMVASPSASPKMAPKSANVNGRCRICGTWCYGECTMR